MSNENRADFEELPDLDEPVKKRSKSRFRFDHLKDIEVLKEVLAIKPFAVPHGKIASAWEKIAANLGFGVKGPAIQKHVVETLIPSFKKQTAKQIRSSGDDEDVNEKDSLLQDLCDLLDSEDLKKKEEKTAAKEKEVNEVLAAKSICEQALQGLSKDSGDSKKERISSKKTEANLFSLLKARQEEETSIKKEEIRLKEEKLAMQKEKMNRDYEEREKDRQIEAQRLKIQEENQKMQNNLMLALINKLDSQK